MIKYRLKQDFMNMKQDEIIELTDEEARIMKDIINVYYSNEDIHNIVKERVICRLKDIITHMENEEYDKIKSLLVKHLFGDAYGEGNYYIDFFDITKDLTKNYICDIKDVIDFLEETKMIPLKKENVKTCSICGEILETHGNNPQPFTNKGECCDNCNVKYVIPARIDALKQNKKEKENEKNK